MGSGGGVAGAGSRVLRGGDPAPAANLCIAMETAEAADPVVPAAQPRMSRRGDTSRLRRPAAAERAAHTLERELPGLGRR